MKLLIVCLLLIISSALRIEACSCIEYGVPPCEEYKRATAVFIGKVRAIIGTDKPRESLEATPVRFDVEQVFKGSVGPSVDVGYIFDTSCSWAKFEVGDRWLIYAYEDRNKKGLQIPFCTGSQEYNESTDDAQFLQDLRQGKTQESVMVRIPVDASVDVSVSNQKETFRGTAREDSVFRANVPAAGEYRVRINVPFAAIISSFDREFAVQMLEQTDSRSVFEYQAAVEKGLCSWRQVELSKIDLKATAAISGRLVDAERRPVAGVPVFLAKWNIDEEESIGNREMASTGDDGRFRFEALREGKYVVLVNPYDFPAKDVPYLKTYLPGVPRFSDAFVIELEQEKEASIIDFVLPRKLRSRTVEVQVVWPDGKPVTHQNPAWKGDRPPWISVYKPTGDYLEHPDVMRLPKKGRYSFSLYEGFSYVISAEAYDAKGETSEGFVKLTVTKDLKPLKITLAPGTADAKKWLESVKER